MLATSAENLLAGEVSTGGSTGVISVSLTLQESKNKAKQAIASNEACFIRILFDDLISRCVLILGNFWLNISI
jgi:hypothetical protein